jgi:hypothetical protein
MVVSKTNPGVTNWIETLGHRRAYLQFRWQRADRQLTPADGPTVEVVAVGDIPAKLPHYSQNQISEEGWRSRIAERQTAIGARMLG